MALQFKIQIEDVTKPPVWRKVLVPETFTFHKLHQVIQAAFGWENSHLYQFSEKENGSDEIIGIPTEDDDDWEAPVIDSRTKKLKEIFSKEGKRFIYIYDLGDDWVHKIILEKIVHENRKKAACIDGKGACPPENCGGVWGYEDIKETFVRDPKGKKANEFRDWLGLGEDEIFDINKFSLDDANAAVMKV
ncbi:MAG: plasmid pRiA4b ORF-3 family protein [Prevotellaceae bacterium]|jgi:hypothetical protein|nr:plasmid pRiA4b ORF-3 family protein [Prevotellaceae bacterium]